MQRIILTLILVLLAPCLLYAQQHSPLEAYNKFKQVTSLFQANVPYSCSAIVEVNYKNGAENTIRDTSRLIYKNGTTYYKSRRIERIEGPEGQLMVNHELRQIVFELSDSITNLIKDELGAKPDKELEALLDADYEEKDEAAFKKFVVEHCNVSWTETNGINEIIFTPKQKDHSVLSIMKLRFMNDGRVLYYKYENSDIYATDWNGNKQYRNIATIYDNFNYNNVPQVPARLSDYLAWNGWTLKLKKFTDYKFSLL